MTGRDDDRLNGRHPEFARMSLRPGIGADFVPLVAGQLYHLYVQGYSFLDFTDSQGDVPSALRHGSRLLPLGRYLRRRLRKEVGLDEKAPCEAQIAYKKEMRVLQEYAHSLGLSFKELSQARADNVIKKFGMYNSNRSI